MSKWRRQLKRRHRRSREATEAALAVGERIWNEVRTELWERWPGPFQFVGYSRKV